MRYARQAVGLLMFAMLLGARVAAGEVWIVPARGVGEGSDPAEKTFLVRDGAARSGAAIGEESEAFVIDPDGGTIAATVEGDLIRFRAPLKGHHWIYYTRRSVREGLLEAATTKLRFYNSTGDVSGAVAREIRGKTATEKYDRPPVSGIPAELIPLKPAKDHHIACCLFAGDLVRLRLVREGAPVEGGNFTVRTGTGWSNEVELDANGEGSFVLPLTVFTESGEEKFRHLGALVVAELEEERSADLGGVPFRKARTVVTLPVMYHPPVSDWAAKEPAFLFWGGTTVALGFGVFLYRRRERR